MQTSFYQLEEKKQRFNLNIHRMWLSLDPGRGDRRSGKNESKKVGYYYVIYRMTEQEQSLAFADETAGVEEHKVRNNLYYVGLHSIL